MELTEYAPIFSFAIGFIIVYSFSYFCTKLNQIKF